MRCIRDLRFRGALDLVDLLCFRVSMPAFPDSTGTHSLVDGAPQHDPGLAEYFPHAITLLQVGISQFPPHSYSVMCEDKSDQCLGCFFVMNWMLRVPRPRRAVQQNSCLSKPVTKTRSDSGSVADLVSLVQDAGISDQFGDVPCRWLFL